MPFQEYSPEQAALLPLHVRDVLSEKHLVFLISARWRSRICGRGSRCTAKKDSGRIIPRCC
jgi:hypothetical protein